MLAPKPILRQLNAKRGGERHPSFVTHL